MECELWPRLYQVVWQVGKGFHRPRVRYSDAAIVLVFLWACLHDRPLGWACDSHNWKSTRWKLVRLPSDTTLSRRLRCREVQELMTAIENHLRARHQSSLWKIIDGKALTIGACSKDPDAKSGRASRGMGRGYKLYAIWGFRLFPEAWEVRSLNVNEKRVARELLPQLQGAGYLLADGEYDASGLHDECQAHQHQLVSPRMRHARGFGHGGYLSPHRVHALEMLERPFGQTLLEQRKHIERFFAHATIFSGGLGPLPAWVRRHHRVARWVWAKLFINAVRITYRKRLRA
jgi:hypothetical protein